MLETMYYVWLVTSISIFFINFFAFAWVLKLVVTNSKKVLEYKTALIYSVVFTLFSIIWYYIGSFFINWWFLLYVIWSIVWWIAIFIFWKNIKKDTFITWWLVTRVVIANFFLLLIFSLILTIIIQAIATAIFF